jgi:hypothetical protein
MAIHGKDAAFSLEDSAGTTLRDIAATITNIAFSRSNDVHDETTLGDDGHEYMVGLTDGSIKIDGFWDDTANTGSATVLDSLLGLMTVKPGWEHGPEGSGAGAVKYSGSCVLETLDYTDPVAGLITFSATLKISGPVTKGTYSA